MITLEETLAALKYTKKQQGPGHDDLKVEMLNSMGEAGEAR